MIFLNAYKSLLHGELIWPFTGFNLCVTAQCTIVITSTGLRHTNGLNGRNSTEPGAITNTSRVLVAWVCVWDRENQWTFNDFITLDVIANRPIAQHPSHGNRMNRYSAGGSRHHVQLYVFYTYNSLNECRAERTFKMKKGKKSHLFRSIDSDLHLRCKRIDDSQSPITFRLRSI